MLLILVVDFWRKVGRGGVGGWEGERREDEERRILPIFKPILVNFANLFLNFVLCQIFIQF